MFFCDYNTYFLFFCHRCKLIVVMVAKASNVLKVSKVLIKTQFKRCAYSKGSMTPMVFLKGLCYDVSNDFILPLFISIMHGIDSWCNSSPDSLYLRGGGMKGTDLERMCRLWVRACDHMQSYLVMKSIRRTVVTVVVLEIVYLIELLK